MTHESPLQKHNQNRVYPCLSPFPTPPPCRKIFLLLYNETKDTGVKDKTIMERLALIIEDNTELAYIYGAALETLGYRTENIEDGKKALQRLAEIVPDLIILDMNLPHVSGHYIYKKLRSDEQFARTPIIVATANQLIADALREEISAIDRLLVKPVSPSQLRAVAKGILEQVSSKR